MKAGAGFITIDNSGISLSGPGIRLNSGGSPGSGRGVFVQAPALPFEAAVSRHGRVEKNPADSASRAGMTPLSLMTPLAQSTPSMVGPVPDSGPAPEILRVTFRRTNNSLDKALPLEVGYDLNGPWTTRWPGDNHKTYNAINYTSVPPGTYALSLGDFDLAPEALKKS